MNRPAFLDKVERTEATTPPDKLSAILDKARELRGIQAEKSDYEARVTELNL